MNRRILLAACAAVGIGAVAAIGAGVLHRQVAVEQPAADRPMLLLLTSLPLIFGEQLSLENNGSPVLTRLEQIYVVRPIAIADAVSLKGHKLLLMAHPRAQPAEALVELDRWVREGGHLLLLADPKLDWPSERPLGDPLRPPPMFADTGLLAHWGLELSPPRSIRSNGPCAVGESGSVASCRLGRGEATVIADADFLNVPAPDAQGLDRLVRELDRLETR